MATKKNTDTSIPAGANVAFGASTTWGWGGGSGGDSAAAGGYEGDSYPKQLAAMNDWKVVNLGIVGDELTAATSADKQTGTARFTSFVAANNDLRCIIVWIGNDDISAGKTATQIEDAYETMIKAANAAAVPLFLCTIQPDNYAATNAKEVVRQDVNNWIRAGHANIGKYSVIDLEQVLKGANALTMNSIFVANGHSANPQSGYPHLSVVGYAAVAQAVGEGTNKPVASVAQIKYPS